MNGESKIYVAGHRGMVGSAIVRRLEKSGFHNLVLKTRDELDLTCQAAVSDFFAAEAPEYVFLAAAKVGGIRANSTYPADFLHDNLSIQTNVIDAAWRNRTRKLLFLGSSCIYPRDCPQPIKEEYLLSGPLEPTNQWYAIAKIAGIKLCQAYRQQHGFNAICAMPTNLYGPGDNYHPLNSHVIAALIQRFHAARRRGDKEVTVWGTGMPLREFLHVDDLADACLLLMQTYESGDPINIGSGDEISIGHLAHLVASIVGMDGYIRFDPSMPDGTPRKILDMTRLQAMGWERRISLESGIKSTYARYLQAVEGLEDA